jgi:DNA-binding CsgD family transcriptional regulator
MDRRDLQLSLVQDLLAAPGSTDAWEHFLAQLCDALHGCGGNVISHSLDSGHSNVSVFARTDPDAVKDYQLHWCHQDAWRNAADPADMKAGRVIVGDAVLSRGQFTRTPFYNEFGRRYEIGQCLAGIVESSPRAITNVSINRSDRRRRFDSADADLLRALMPHLQRAVETHRRLAGAELMAANTSAVLDRLPHGVILVSEAGVVLSTNHAADTILRARDALGVERGELRASTIALTNRLRAALDTAIRTCRGLTLDSGSAGFALPRPSGRRPLSIVIAPLPAHSAVLGPNPAAAAIFVTDPERPPLPNVPTIREVFQMTESEARLVRCLLSGLSVDESATRLGIRVETARKRLKVIFEKTDTHRQASLVALVLTSAAIL